MRWMAFPPRYARSEVGLNGIAKPLDSHGFCQGATPFSSIWTMLSVTSCRKSRGGLSFCARADDWVEGEVISVPPRRIVSSFRFCKIGLGNFIFETRSGKVLPA